MFPATWMPTVRAPLKASLARSGSSPGTHGVSAEVLPDAIRLRGEPDGEHTYSGADKKRSALMYSPDPLTDT